MDPQSPDSAPSPASIAPITDRLAWLRFFSRLMLMWQRLGWLLAVFVAGGVAVAITDYLLRMPGWLRGGFLGLGGAVSLWIIIRHVAPAARFNPSLTEFALRVEQSPGGRRAGLVGLLASAVDLAQTGGARAKAVIDEAVRRAQTVGTLELLRPGRMLAATGAAAAVALMVVGFFVARPSLATIGSLRILAPWAEVEWPKRTDVEDAMREKVHPLGTALALQAALLSSQEPAEKTRVEARYRIIDSSGAPGPVRRVALTCQERLVQVATKDALGNPMNANGTLFERLIEPGALEPTEDKAAKLADASKPAFLEYWFSSQDDETPPQRVLLARPPSVLSAWAEVAPPAYARGVGALRSDLGPGNDERANLSGLLVGSRITLKIKLNKPLPNPSGESPTAGGVRSWLSTTVGEQFAALVVDRSDAEGERRGTAFAGVYQGDEWTLSWTARDSVRLAVRPRDQYGIDSDSESVFRVEARTDRPPEATVTKPAEDGEVLATASLAIAGEGRDDVALASVAAQFQLARKPEGSEGAPPEPLGEPASIVGVSAGEAGAAPDARTITAIGSLDLASIGAKAGDELWITALATDAYELDGERHEPVRSAVRKIRIISSEQLVEQVWSELAAVRRNAIRMAEQQTALRESVERRTDGPAASRDQSALSESASRQDRTVEKLAQRLKDNGFKDDELKGVLDQARSLLKETRDAAGEAGGALRQQQDAKAAGEQPKADKAREQAQREQARAQDALENLAELLDKGQDAWSIRRGLEKLLDEQKQLREATSKLGEQTVGKSPEQLSPQQRQQAGQLSEQQRDLSQRAEELVSKMQQQAEALKQQDPATASALSEAARKAEQAKIPEKLEQAAKQIQQNQQQRANQQQDQAAKAIQDVLDQLQQASRNRDEVLQRELASLIDSLDALIARQGQELKALDVGEAAGRLTGLDARMIALRTNTLGVLDQARAAGRETREVASLIESATVSQADAVSALRAQPADAGEARTDEQTALDRLKDARKKAEEAKNAADDRNARRQRAELKKAYRELLDQQIDLRTRTKDAGAIEAGRRQKAAARDLAPPQDQIRQKAAELAGQSKDIGKSDVFKFAHERLDELTSAASARLVEGEADSRVINRQSLAIRVLTGVLEALAEQDQKDDEFREDAGGQQGGEGGQSGQKSAIPEGAEIKLLRDQQVQALELTRAASDEHDAGLNSDAAKLQRRLFELAKSFMEKAQRRQQQDAEPKIEPGPGKPADPADAPAQPDMPAGGDE